MSTNQSQTLSALPRTPCSPVGFSPVAPVYEGGYYMRCMENDYDPEWVAVYWKDGVLRANLDSLGDYPLGMIHQGLTDVTWRHAISSSENSALSNGGTGK